MFKKISFMMFLIGVLSTLVGMPYLLGFSTNGLLKYPLYLGLIVFVIFAPKPNLTKLFQKK